MKKLSITTLAALLLALLISGTPTLAMPRPPHRPPLAVIKAFNFAYNAHDAEAVLALVADDAIFRFEPAALLSRKGIYTGVAEIRPFVQAGVKDVITIESRNYQVAGDKVTWTTTASLASLRQLGVESIELASEAIVQGGKITSWTATLTPGSLAQIEQAVALSQTLAQIGADSSSIPTWLVALAGLGLLGTGWALLEWKGAHSPKINVRYSLIDWIYTI